VPPSSHDEVVAAAFVVAWKKFALVENPTLPWLYRIASFEVAHERRRLGRIPVTVELPDLGATDSYALEDVMDISSAFTSLSDTDRDVLRLLYWEDLRRSEIAEVLGCTINALNVRIHRAHEHLRRALPQVERLSDIADHPPTEVKED
jgi:RNA polymerase sigma-70 factor (ECF subfamily)